MKTNVKPVFFYSSFIYPSKRLYNKRFLKKNLNSSTKLIEKNNILFKIKLKNYSGVRHQGRLPVRGQRTKTNSRTCKLRKKLKK